MRQSKIKIITIIIASLLLLSLLIIIAGNFIYPLIKLKNEITKLPNGYYQELGRRCKSAGCCLSSVKAMAAGSFKLIPKNGCPDGFQPNMLTCADSYKWCESKTKTAAIINSPQNQTEKYYQVVKIVDGDTIDVDMNGKIDRVRLIGADTAEVVDQRKSVECFGQEASNKASELLLNQKVRLVNDQTQSDRDKYGRLLRYIYREDGLFYNQWLIKNGYAHEYTHTIPYQYQAEFKQAEKDARENKLGLWSPEICDL